MKRLIFNLNQGSNVFKFDEPLNLNSNSLMRVANIDVFWDFDNLPEEGVINYGADIDFEPGYWSFEDIQKKLKANDVSLKLNTHNSTCIVYGEDHPVKLGSLAPILGFPKDTIIKADTSTKSPQKVDINLGTKFLNITCNLAKFSSNYFNGSFSQTILCLPITSKQKLFGTVSHFSDRNCIVPLYNGSFKEIIFKVTPDSKKNLRVKILLEVEVE